MYLKIGIHTAPDGTLLGLIHRLAWRAFRAMTRQQPSPRNYGHHWYKITDRWGNKFHRSEDIMRFNERLAPDEKVTFDIHDLVYKNKIRGVSLIFFMGLGDYLFATPFIAKLRTEFPTLQIQALVSDGKDMNNNPSVAELLRVDPNVNDVTFYSGKRSALSESDWRNYDYSDAFRKAKPDFVCIPVIYEYGPHTRSRALSLCETFSLNKPDSTTPIIYQRRSNNSYIKELLKRIRDEGKESDSINLVFFHLETRSTNYVYPHIEELIQAISTENCLSISVSPSILYIKSHIHIDISKLTISDSIAFLAMLQTEYGSRLSIIATQSVFAVVSSGLGVPCLQLQHRIDGGISSLWFDNITVLTNEDYASLPQENIILADAGQYKLEENECITYSPDAVIGAWKKMMNRRKREN